jgi:tRNA-2-methylthio-N6-dimethylallyladenosine synthase
VGFCGETDEDFEKTCELVRECRFKNSFIFKYSERQGTKAETLFPDDIPFEVKQWRNNELLAIQNAISEELNTALLGRTMDVLVEGASKRAEHESDTEIISSPKQLMGRTHCDRIVVFEGDESVIGKIVPVAIVDTSPHTLFGAMLDTSVDLPRVALAPLLG